MIYPKRTAIAVLLLALECMAQPAAELLQKGIYLQETAGDLDGAVKVYRQVTASAAPQSAAAAQAQYRIAEIMLQKGDLNGAATEFNNLAVRYSEHQALIAKMARRMDGFRKPAGGSTGAMQNGWYRNRMTGLGFPLNEPWRIDYDGPSSDDGEMVGLTDGSSVVF